MRPPGFWWHDTPGPAARLLAPLGRLYGGRVARRMGRPGVIGPVPVVCIGNFTLGGAGKTPTALAVAAMLRAMGQNPAFLSRGYGGRLPGPVAVDPARHGPDAVGDEPLLLARAGPAVVARDRVAGAALCAALGADVVVMDDGLQNPALRKDLVLAVVDAATGAGNRLSFPAGPLRAPLPAQWPHVSALVVIGDGEPGERLAREAAGRGLPVLRAALVPDLEAAAALRGRPVLAFAGIGRPEKFFATLAEAGADLRRTRAFADHHRFTAPEIAGLVAEARRDGLALVTTEKDRVRLPADLAVAALPVTLAFAEPDRLRACLSDSALGA
ncbi:tetraacyldisaccharide 4'-kinase [Methylobacterium oryzihabitans]|uniref:Tetraacyldisaccharide 4'-kinase n=1 Tax=Methylobacterium oryzihabitans TaxID=2499852 RepID=A0A437P331_9HYPH|nr:tetraacyldisaccharide 4'-kinase [Methylobacterium oryzihabitans]RVU16697.1 tetraacyldisaccharide 4'-kinase [Methylobacterium oryzihabitans]